MNERYSKFVKNHTKSVSKRLKRKKTGTQRTATQTVAFNVHMSTVFSYRPDKSGSRFVRSTIHTYTYSIRYANTLTHTFAPFVQVNQNGNAL